MKTSIYTLMLFSLCFLVGCKEKSRKASQKTELAKIENIIVLNDGTKLTYFIEGEGYPCIVVTEGELLANAISKELKSHFKFIFVNARMNVKDPGDIDKITFNVLIDDVEQIRQVLKLGKVSVLGHSVSGLIAFEYARKYPLFTSHVIMNGTSPFEGTALEPFSNSHWETNASKVRKEALAKNWRKISKDSLDRLGTSEAGKLKYILDGPKCFYDYNFRADSLLKNSYWNMAVWNQIFDKEIVGYDISKGNTVNTPVFISQGKYDFMDPYMAWDNFKSKIPNLSFHVFEKSGHYSLYEEEELFRKELLIWFDNTKDQK
jgi:proline iminopeptidase